MTRTMSAAPQPKVTGIAPATDALAGVTMLTITGENFKPSTAQNMVFFDAAVATLTSATATQLMLKAPVVIGDSIKVKVAVQGADLFSTPYLYKLEAPTENKFGNFGANDEVASMDCDTAGNVFVSMLSSGLGTGVWKFTPDGTKGTTAYSNPFSGAVGSWKGMKFGPGGAIFCVAARAIIFRIPPGGGNAAVWVSGSGLSNLNDLDFDAAGNIWTSGTAAASIFRIKQDKSVQAFPFVGIGPLGPRLQRLPLRRRQAGFARKGLAVPDHRRQPRVPKRSISTCRGSTAPIRSGCTDWRSIRTGTCTSGPTRPTGSCW